MSNLVRTVTLEAADLIGSVTKREALAFKAGGWASLPMEYVGEKYVLPYVQRRFGEKAFYNKISQFGSTSQQTPRVTTAGKMAAKRKYTGDSAINKRLKRVERIANANRGEMKMATWTSSGTVTQGTQNVLDLTSLIQGVGDDQRVGNRIKVWRIEVRGYAIGQLDHYILQKHGTVNPVYTDFGTGAYAFVDAGSTNKFTEWLSFRSLCITPGSNASYREVLKFPMGLVVHYDDSTTQPVQNGVLFVSRNTTTVDYAQNFSLRIWYTDK